MDEVKELLKVIYSNPKARELLNASSEPATTEEAIELYADIAAKSGVSVTKENLQKFFEQKEKIQKAMTAEAESAVKEALDEEDLDNVAGGTAECKGSVNRGEWCFVTDSCAYIIRYYDGVDADGGDQGDALECTVDFYTVGSSDDWVDLQCTNLHLNSKDEYDCDCALYQPDH